MLNLNEISKKELAYLVACYADKCHGSSTHDLPDYCSVDSDEVERAKQIIETCVNESFIKTRLSLKKTINFEISSEE